GAIASLAGESCAYPVVKWRRHDPYHLRSLCLLPQHQQHFRSLSLARRAKLLYLVDRHGVEEEVLLERRCVARLLPDDFGRSVLEDSRPVESGLGLRAHEVFYGLRDAPHAAVTFARRAE